MLCYHLIYNSDFDRRVDFGKYRNLTYAQLYNAQDEEYINWCRMQDRPCEQMRALLRWFNNERAWFGRSREILPVARYFQVDQCSSCGVIITDEEHLATCAGAGEEQELNEEEEPVPPPPPAVAAAAAPLLK